MVLKVTEALRLLDVDEVEGEEEQITEAGADRASESQENGAPAKASEPTTVDKFCTLVSLLATLHPRIKTKYPSRFLSTSLVAVLAAYRPSNQATLAVIALLQSLSGNKRPPLPHRKSSLSSRVRLEHKPDTSAPDPEATAEDPHEGGIQKKLLQSFATHVLEVYIKANTLEWSARLQEHFEPKKVVTGKKSFGEAFKEDATLVDRDMVAGQLVVSLLSTRLLDLAHSFRPLLVTWICQNVRFSSMPSIQSPKHWIMRRRRNIHPPQKMSLCQELDLYSLSPSSRSHPLYSTQT